MKKLSLLFTGLLLINLQGFAADSDKPIQDYVETLLTVGLGVGTGYVAESFCADYKGTTRHAKDGMQAAGPNMFKTAVACCLGLAVSPLLFEDTTVLKGRVALASVVAAATFAGIHYKEMHAQTAKKSKTIAVAQAK